MSETERTTEELADEIARLVAQGQQLRAELEQHRAEAFPDLVAMVEDAIDDPEIDEVGARAAKLLGESKDPRAIDVLLRAVETCKPGEWLFDAAVFALIEIGAPVLEPVLARLAAGESDDEPPIWLEILSQLGIADERIYQHLVAALPKEPPFVASCLANYGDRRALLHVHREFDALRLTVDPNEDHWVLDMAAAVDSLGGVLTDGERRKLAAFEATRDRKLRSVGRNDPCWCGSGKKYKRCHEAMDREDDG